MPGARVAIDLVGAPALGSKVSMWLGPPFIHRTMQARAFLEALEALDGRLANKRRGAAHKLKAPPRPSCKNVRRFMSPSLFAMLMVERELARVEQRPK